MKSPRMESLLQCKKPTSQYAPSKYPSLCSAVNANSANMWKHGATFRHGTVSALKQYLYEKEATGMESPKMESLLQCKSPPRSTDRQSTRVHEAPCRPDSAKMRKHGATFRHGAVSALKQYLYEKEATGIESPTMESLLQCKKPTSHYGPSKYPYSSSAV